MRIKYFGPMFQFSGYAAASHDYISSLIVNKADVNVRPLLDADPKWLDRAGRFEPLLEFTNRQDAEAPEWPTHLIAHSIPWGCSIFVTEEMTPAPNVKRVAMTTWESSVLPARAAKELNDLFDQVWVPTTYCATAAAMTGDLDFKKIRVVPHTFDPSWWFRYKEQMAAPGPYTFYNIMTWCERKNGIGLLKAYLTEFTNKDDVLLKIKTPHYDMSEIQELVAGLKLNADALPPVELICDPYTEDEMYDLHTQSHCYVTCARSEGWGLGAFEAALVGNPVIYPSYSGFTEFLPEYCNGCPVDYFLTPCYVPKTQHPDMVIEVAGLKATAITRNAHTDIDGLQVWAEPDLWAIKQLMREAYEERLPKNYSSRQHFAEKYGYKAVGKQILGLLKDM